jgi:hypothetical protein
MAIIKKILVGLLVVLLILQFFGIDKENPTADPSLDLIALTSPNDDVKSILVAACYDCHSFKTVYPWYTNIAPLSWWIKDHIDEGRKELNFSEWGNYSDRRKDHKMEEMVELVEEGEMPLQSYTIAHSNARLSEAQKEAIIAYAKKVREDIGYVPEVKE